MCVCSPTTHCVLNVYRNTLSIMIINWSRTVKVSWSAWEKKAELWKSGDEMRMRIANCELRLRIANCELRMRLRLRMLLVNSLLVSIQSTSIQRMSNLAKPSPHPPTRSHLHPQSPLPLTHFPSPTYHSPLPHLYYILSAMDPGGGGGDIYWWNKNKLLIS